MEASLWFWSVSVLLLVVTSPALSEIKPVYFKNGGELVLLPAGTHGAITSLEWQIESASGVFQVVQWVKDKLPLTYYNRFKDRAEVNLITGELHLSEMKRDDEGKFTVEINNVQQSVKFDAKLMNELTEPGPVIHVTPPTCSSASTHCVLTCFVNTSRAEPITYSWSLDDGPWKEGQKDLPIVKQTGNAKSYRCRVKNYVSQGDSVPLPDPFSRPTTELHHWVVVWSVLAVSAVALPAFTWVLYYFREREPIRRCLSFLPCVKRSF